MTTQSIDHASMTDKGDLCTREMERVGWCETRHTVLVSEDLATGGILSAKGNEDPWMARKIKDDIEKFWIRRRAFLVSSRIKNKRLLTSRGQ